VNTKLLGEIKLLKNEREDLAKELDNCLDKSERVYAKMQAEI
jgi:hypothetical protein